MKCQAMFASTSPLVAEPGFMKIHIFTKFWIRQLELDENKLCSIVHLCSMFHNLQNMSFFVTTIKRPIKIQRGTAPKPWPEY